MIIHTLNMPGNFHHSADYINRNGLANYLIQLHAVGHGSIAVFRMTQEQLQTFKRKGVL